ncbi:hypothetical protein TSAR_005765 [Trichomalopsis sarcophagae]|uniref:Uncharacterized protein n=1 Tax=Trichomalopsis sarcophagae TaxID=543379 RepID=A0A232EN23_9HYME|nr:hypothetical protein TSAR_005765 [Trichomalopsis sarcophagae]
MLTLHYYYNGQSVDPACCFDDIDHEDDAAPVYSEDLIKEFDTKNPPLEDELAWILSKANF